MIDRRIGLKSVLQDVKTYPSWTAGREYSLDVSPLSLTEILVSYRIDASAVPRRIKRVFPAKIRLTPRFCWMLGFLRGEGANKLGKSNYRRVTITNTNAEDMRIVLDELGRAKLLRRSELRAGAVHIFAREPSEAVKRYWSEHLQLPPTTLRIFKKENSTTQFGTCHIYHSDVLLRRVLDCIQGAILANAFL
jgi:hypothetical protein